MGLVIVSLIVSVISFVLILSAMYFYDKYSTEIIQALCVIGGIISGCVLVVSASLFIVNSVTVSSSYIKNDIELQESKNKRQQLTRMLLEDYNTQNLSNAIEFNNKQKMIEVENNSFLFKYTTQYYSVDTIQIPDYKFMPTSKLIVDVNSN